MKENKTEINGDSDKNLFVLIDDDDDACGFVSIDENSSSEPLLIDMSDFEFYDLSDTLNPYSQTSDTFVTIDDSTTFVSDFNEDELII